MSCLIKIIIVVLSSWVISSYTVDPSIFFSTTPNDSIIIDERDDASILCAGKKCIAKCCPKNEYIIETSKMFFNCKPFDGDSSFENVSLYDSGDYESKTNFTLREIFLLVPNKFDDKDFIDMGPIMFTVPEIGMRNYLTVNGDLLMELPNAYNRWTVLNSSMFCVDYNGNASTPEISFWAVIPFVYVPPNTTLYSAGFLVSSVFLFLVIVVYCLLPELLNLVGKVLMGYVFSLLVGFTSMATIQIGHFQDQECIILTVVIYFFMLSSFCWMNVMSYDIWWTFRGYAKARPIHRRGENFKFAMYSLYAWGVPLATSIFFVVVDNTDLSDTPWFIKPQINKLGCFLSDGQQFVYMYIPMMILIISNWMFFFMTAFNIWRLNRGTAILDRAAAGTPAAHRSQKNRLMVYVKVSFIMGTNWILEVISSFYPELKVWYLTDLYNNLMGLGIFFIFICNRKIYKKLKEKFQGISFPKRSLTKSHTTSTIDSNTSQEMQSVTLQVSSDPRGLRHR